jgi:KDO2-lipid IV(A) lauroyltransferase
MRPSRDKNSRFAEKILLAPAVFSGFLRSIGRNVSAASGHLLGDFVFYVLRYRSRLVLKNLFMAFPEKTSAEIRAVARKVYRNQGENIMEILRLPLIRTAVDASGVIEIDTAAILSKTIGRNKGGVVVSAHFGNWELLAFCSGLLVHPHTIIVKPLKNKFVESLINKLRTMRGNSIVYESRALREGLNILQHGGLVAILGDQSDPNGGLYTTFMGRNVPVFRGPAYLALKAGVPLFVLMCRRNGDGRYTVDVEEIDTTGFGSSRADVEEITRRYIRIVETSVRRYPDEWFWLHDRWKRCRQ